jgi:hypothetical protein
MRLIWDPVAWEDYKFWQTTDRRVLKRINTLVDASVRDPFGGIGKPEQLQSTIARKTEMNADQGLIEDLSSIYDRTRMVGWDFSRLDGRLTSDEPWWNFEADCLTAMHASQRIADLGTGGGERLAGLLDRMGRRGAPGSHNHRHRGLGAQCRAGSGASLTAWSRGAPLRPQ